MCVCLSLATYVLKRKENGFTFQRAPVKTKSAKRQGIVVFQDEGHKMIWGFSLQYFRQDYRMYLGTWTAKVRGSLKSTW